MESFWRSRTRVGNDLVTLFQKFWHRQQHRSFNQTNVNNILSFINPLSRLNHTSCKLTLTGGAEASGDIGNYPMEILAPFTIIWRWSVGINHHLQQYRCTFSHLAFQNHDFVPLSRYQHSYNVHTALLTTPSANS